MAMLSQGCKSSSQAMYWECTVNQQKYCCCAAKCNFRQGNKERLNFALKVLTRCVLLPWPILLLLFLFFFIYFHHISLPLFLPDPWDVGSQGVPAGVGDWDKGMNWGEEGWRGRYL